MKDREKLRSLLPAAGLALATLALALALLRPADAAPAAVEAPAAESVNPTAPPYVLLSGELYAPDERILSLPGVSPPAAELLEALAAFPALERVELPDGDYSPGEQDALLAAFPGVEFLWPVEVCGVRFSSADTDLSFAGRTDISGEDLREIREAAGRFLSLERLDLTGCGAEGTALYALSRALPGVEVLWDFDLYGVEVRSDAEEIDLSGHAVTDGAALLESRLPWMPGLRKAVMCECGLSDEEMDALCRRHGDIRFVWQVTVRFFTLRTDSTYYIPHPASGLQEVAPPAGYEALRYCTDLTALDLGHTMIGDISFLYNMPHLQYLILAECYTNDLTPVGTLKELKWLELFMNTAMDISPLVNCTALEDLNICHMFTPGENLVETLSQMPWLKRLWCCGTALSYDQLAELRRALPDTEIWYAAGGQSTGSTWRYSQSYYDMRDAFHMYYMDYRGNATERLSDEELAAIHKRFWGW